MAKRDTGGVPRSFGVPGFSLESILEECRDKAPEETAAPFISKWNRQVASGPVMAEASVGAIQMRGFLMILPIWSILVPRPWLTRPPTPFSL